ncbi:MAG TPA: PQQ-binding-like beta-propeller repeat protein [Acidimicrobiales bacterium]|nr:PQQ-binding-like beta-propeller repeat protein [Acidimicrobiales bacterium]
MALTLIAALAACGSGSPTAHHRGAHSPATAAPTTTAPPSTTARPTTTATAPAPSEWTTYGGNNGRRSLDSAEGVLGHAPTPAWTSAALDGAVYGEPLIFGGQVLVATENDTVYALSAATGAVTWSLHLGAPAASSALPCGDIAPVVGVTSTMVIDPASDTLFVSAELASGGVAHELFAVDLTSHTVRFQRGLDQPGWSSAAQLQRAALALEGGEVLVAFGGLYGDCGSYNGWVVGVPTSGSGPLATYKVPSEREGGIWEPAGPSVDGAGDVYVATGNGSSDTSYDHGNSVIELSPALAELSHFADPRWAADNDADADLGSTSPLLLGDGRLFQVGKQMTGYLLHTGAPGGAAASVALCNSRGATAYLAPVLYVVCTDTHQIVPVHVGPGDSLQKGAAWTSPTAGAGSPTIARGVVWTLDPGRDVLYGLDPGTLAQRYSVALSVGGLTHFAAPSAGEGLIVVAGTRAVEALH